MFYVGFYTSWKVPSVAFRKSRRLAAACFGEPWLLGSYSPSWAQGVPPLSYMSPLLPEERPSVSSVTKPEKMQVIPSCAGAVPSLFKKGILGQLCKHTPVVLSVSTKRREAD